MTTSILKKQIIKKIEDLNDHQMLEDVKNLLTLYSDMDEIVKLSPEQKNSIKQSMDDVKKGRVISHEKLNKEIKKWLNE